MIMNIQNWRTDLIESELTDKAKLVGLVLSVYWNNRNKIYPSLTTLENDCSLTKNTIIKAIEELKGGNFIIVNKEHHRKSSYMVNTYTLTGVTTAPMNAPANDTVNEQANDRANDRANDSVASAPMNAPELGIRELDNKKDTKVSQKKAVQVEKPVGISDKLWSEYKTHRAKKRGTITDRIIKDRISKAKILGISLQEVLECEIDKAWNGFEIDWYNNSKGSVKPHHEEQELEFIPAN